MEFFDGATFGFLLVMFWNALRVESKIDRLLGKKQ
jgi:hypothetical protein